MSVQIISGSNAPENTNVIMGEVINQEGENKSIFIDIETISPAGKQIYDDFFSVIGLNAKVIIKNSPYNYDGNHVTPLSVDAEIVEIDYNELPAAAKAKIDAGFQLLSTLIE
jgi:hypothetical protein